MKQGDFNRKTYERIRKMDHNQMKEFINGIQNESYKVGHEDGAREASENRGLPDLDGLEDELQKARGVGGAKARIISDRVKEFLENKRGGAE